MSTNNLDENGRIAAELNIENFDSEDSDEKLSLVFNRKRDIPAPELADRELLGQESLTRENEDKDTDTNNEYTDENGRMAVEFNVNLMPLKTSQLENDLEFQTKQEVENSIQVESEIINQKIDTEVERLDGRIDNIEEEVSGAIKSITGDDLIDVERDGNNVQLKSKTFVFEQGAASSTWTITHNLNKRPSVNVVDSAGEVQTPDDIIYNNSNSITVKFLAAFRGEAYLN